MPSGDGSRPGARSPEDTPVAPAALIRRKAEAMTGIPRFVWWVLAALIVLIFVIVWINHVTFKVH